MKYIIDLIEDIREEINNDMDFTVHAMLLKEDSNDASKLVNSGESVLTTFDIDADSRKLIFSIDSTTSALKIEALVKHLLILDMDMMMYEIKLNINQEYKEVDVVGFGKSTEDKKYFLFIKL